MIILKIKLIIISNETDTRIKAKLLWSINYCKERLKELMNN